MKAKALLTAIAASTAMSCAQMGSHEQTDVCGDVDRKHVCSVPFEAVYAHREALVGRNVRSEGMLVVGVRPEPPGSEIPVMLLFSSIERARICSPEFAIELAPASEEIANEIRSANGWYVSVAGRLQQSQKGHWAELKVISATPIGGRKEDLHCMSVLPPQLPESK